MPDMIICRCENPLSQDIKDKISLFCSVRKDMVIDETDVDFSIYEVPISLKSQQIDVKVCQLLHLPEKKSHLKDWEDMVHKMRHPKGKIVIGIVGKYLQHQDAYKSVFEALQHAAIYHQV